eukprot:9860234-Lingulodinium_polyedra.AAC.1
MEQHFAMMRPDARWRTDGREVRQGNMVLELLRGAVMGRGRANAGQNRAPHSGVLLASAIAPHRHPHRHPRRHPASASRASP